MGVIFREIDSGVIKSPPKDDDNPPREQYPELILGRSDYHKTWLRGLHKGSIQRKHINEYQATYYKAHRDSINAKRRLKRLKDKDSTI